RETPGAAGQVLLARIGRGRRSGRRRRSARRWKAVGPSWRVGRYKHARCECERKDQYREAIPHRTSQVRLDAAAKIVKRDIITLESSAGGTFESGQRFFMLRLDFRGPIR